MTISTERLNYIYTLAKKATYKPCAVHEHNLAKVCDSETMEQIISELLAAREAQPVGWILQSEINALKEGRAGAIWPYEIATSISIKLYTAPPTLDEIDKFVNQVCGDK